ncbi:MAG: hypothetical protein CMI66_08970 [Pedosphaera sp.]|nr:hypothetical protein [Pedosphaera sp.]HCP37709.1 hypothetical protein [Verrucomicrobiales bacterium]
MEKINPYKAPASDEVDRIINQGLFGESSSSVCPSYSTDDSLVQKMRRKLQNTYNTLVVVGRTRIKSTPYFARYGTDVSTSTEVLAETKALAICRMALLLIQRSED